jgi:hypothetical protein
MADLDPRIEAVRKAYDLQRNDFWELPQRKGTWLAKHSALEAVAVAAKVEFMPPQILEAKTEEGVCALVVEGRLPDGRGEWSTGEASPKNNKNAYPWAMAEKRAKDRVILKLVGLHGLVYSEDEMAESPMQPSFEAPNSPRQPKAKSKELYERLQEDVRACASCFELESLMKSDEMVADMASLPVDWEDQLKRDAAQTYRDLKRLEAKKEPVPPNFDDLPQDTREALDNMSAG